ncbi:hypothetical protein [Streptomyces sp. NPDC026673]|uniref:hypothetical protein n=1 Tax=Streptomyces sp. NPDC026673 TaxID=3155724 RepID=UPI0033D91713
MPAGLAHWSDGNEQQIIAWSRLMSLGLEAQPGKATSSKGFVRMTKIMANLSGVPYMGNHGVSVAATLRHPYEYWNASCDHHSRKYSPRHIKLTHEFLRRVVERKMARRLGDPKWMSAAVDKLNQIPKSGSRSRMAAIDELLDGSSQA